jgi:hypothetical protein
VRLLAITLAEPLLEHFFSSHRQVPVAILRLLKKLPQLLVATLLSILEIPHAGLTAL